MLTFRFFTLNESIRQGLPHITTMDHEQFHNLTKTGKIHFDDVTEKTDGQTMMMGHDEHGFYTQSSGSGNEKMRKPEDYADRAKRRSQETGKPLDLTAPKAFGHIHKILQGNEKLQSYLGKKHKTTGEEVKVRGESFYKPWARPSDTKKGEVKFVGTSYDPSHMGTVGKFVLHTKLPENAQHNPEEFKKLSDKDINFDDDIIKHKGGSVNVSTEHKAFKSLNHDLLKARTTKTNKSDKEAETEKFNKIKTAVSAKVDEHVKSLNIAPKWGSGTEGAVIHPTNKNADAPRFKVTSDAFRKYRASDDAKNIKSKRPTDENV